MRPSSSAFVAVVAALCIGVSAGGCRSASRAPLAPVSDPSVASPATTGAEPVAPRAASPEATTAQVYGHFRIARPTEFIAEVASKLLPRSAGSMFTEEMLKSLLFMQFGAGLDSKVVEHIDLSQPMGCAVASPKAYSLPLACAVAYRGGIPQLVKDLGPEGYISGGADFAAYQRADTTFYMSSIDGHLIVATEPELIAASRSTLQNFVVRAPADTAARDLTATLFPRVIWDDAQAEIEGIAGLAEPPAAGPDSDAGFDAYMQGSVSTALETYKSYAELDAAQVWFDLGDDGAEIGYRGTAREGTATAASYAALQAAGPVNADLVRQLPKDAAMISGFTVNPSQLMDDPMVRPYINLLGTVDEAGGNTKFKPMLLDYMKVWQDMISGPMAAAMFWEPKGPKGAGYSVALRPGVDAPTKLRGLFTEYTPEMMGAAFAKYVTWTVKKNAYRVDGLPVDVLSIRPTKHAAAELAKAPGQDSLRKMLGPKSELKFAFTQRDDHLYMGISPSDDKSILRRLLAPGDAATTVGRDSLPGKQLAKHSDANLLILADLGAALRFAASFGSGSKPTLVTGRLDDLVITGRMTPQGNHEYVLRMSQGAIDQLREL